MPTRRGLLKSTLCLAAASRCAWAMPELATPPVTRLQVKMGPPLATIPRNFTGLGYEESSIARPGLLSAANTTYVQLVRALGPGVLRAGGIVADFTAYSAEGPPAFEPKNTVVTRASLQQLRGFLDAVDWTAIWSVNFGRGTLAQAIEEARAVAGTLGPRLLALELGNEVENYSRGAQPLRAPPYPYAAFRAEYSRWRSALLAAVPGLRFAAPDTAASVDWVEQMAADARGEVQLLTTHYYRGDQHTGTRAQLLRTDPALLGELERLRRASTASGIPWRLCEINSFFGGGRPGLSDTLAGALWTLDTMLLLASYGCAGVNMETGFNQLGFLSSYSPIRNDEANRTAAGAPYFGMLAFAVATAGAPDILPVEFDPGGGDVTAYALGREARATAAVLINKTPDRSVRVSVDQLGIHRGSITRLQGPSFGGPSLEGPALDSRDGITLGGASVDGDGRWTGQPAQPAHPLRGEVLLPPASAVLIRQAGPQVTHCPLPD